MNLPNYRILFKSLISLFIIIGVVLFTQISMSNPNKFCIAPEAGDNGIPGSKVINDKYLVIGDSRKNRVTVYSRNNSGEWVKTREILPPKNSIPYKYGEGFGSSVKLDGDTVLIYASISRETTELENPEDFQYIFDAYSREGAKKIEDFEPSDRPRLFISVFAELYLAKLNLDEEIQTFDFNREETSGFKKFPYLSEGRLKQIILPDHGEQFFGMDWAYHNNLFLVGSPSYYRGGGGWLYDLNRPEIEPTRLAISNTFMGETVAVSDKFAVVGASVVDPEIRDFEAEGAPELPRKILIRAIETGATTVIEDLGRLSISGNILAIMHYGSDFTPYHLLKVFRLDKDATPHLIIEREDINHAWVQNGFLVTSERKYVGAGSNDFNFDYVYQLCIEPID